MGELLFCCPLCGGALTRQEHRAVCPQGHSFDVARQGYVHLLPVNKMHSKLPGDSREMVEGRRRFLEAGYYAPFRQELCRLAAACASQLGSPAGEGLLLCDAGCGEGYYTAGLREALPQAQVCGFDISKLAVKAAAGKYKSVEFGVASSFAIPLMEASVHLLTDVFSPLAAEEFARVSSTPCRGRGTCTASRSCCTRIPMKTPTGRRSTRASGLWGAPPCGGRFASQTAKPPWICSP